jgi:hypothetical protein
VTTELPQPQSAATAEPAAELPVGPTAELAVRRSGRGRWIALGTAAVLSAVVVGGGVGLGVLAIVGRPKHQASAAAEAVPAKPPTYGALADGNHFGSLSDLLLPVPGNLEPGPDVPGFGNDTLLTASQFHAFYDKSIATFSSADRKTLENGFQAAHIKAYAVRTYLVSDSMTIEIALRQENQSVAKGDAAELKDLATVTGVFRTGPGVPGFPQARCYLPPLQTGDKLDYLNCDVAVGDMFLSMQVSGVAPLDTASAVGLLSQQLTRLAIPGAQT